MSRTNPNYLEDAQKTLELCKSMYSLYVRANLEEKAKLANLVASNYSLIDVSLYPAYRKPFSFIAEGHSRTNWLPGQDSNLGHTR